MKRIIFIFLLAITTLSGCVNEATVNKYVCPDGRITDSFTECLTTGKECENQSLDENGYKMPYLKKIECTVFDKNFEPYFPNPCYGSHENPSQANYRLTNNGGSYYIMTPDWQLRLRKEECKKQLDIRPTEFLVIEKDIIYKCAPI